ncbi:MAG: amidophosphoribosyltransferase [Pyrobaculum sp.]
MCGIGGAWGEEAAVFVEKMEPWLLHRGHEGVGYAYAVGGGVAVGRPPPEAEGALIHTRYSTTGPYGEVLQPVLARHRDLEIAVVFNGTVVNFRQLYREAKFDGEALAHALARAVWEMGVEEGVRHVYDKIVGAASLLALTPWGLLSVRDPRGVRPLAVRHYHGGFAAASESVALDGGAELAPGVAVLYGRKFSTWRLGDSAEKMCALEYVYFAHNASELGGRVVYSVRRALGRALAEEEDLEDRVDVVAYVPETARVAASAYAEALGKPLVEAVVKSRFAGRIFITPPHARSPGDAFRVVKEAVSGRRVALIDDSLIRGTNIKAVVKMLREAGASEVHVRIASPPIRYPCFFGLDFPTRRELIAHARSVEEVKFFIGADSLRYISLEKFRKVIGENACYGCFTGDYPQKIDIKWAESELAR